MSRTRGPISIAVELLDQNEPIAQATIVAPYSDVRPGMTIQIEGTQYRVAALIGFGFPAKLKVVKRDSDDQVVDPVKATDVKILQTK